MATRAAINSSVCRPSARKMPVAGPKHILPARPSEKPGRENLLVALRALQHPRVLCSQVHVAQLCDLWFGVYVLPTVDLWLMIAGEVCLVSLDPADPAKGSHGVGVAPGFQDALMMPGPRSTPVVQRPHAPTSFSAAPVTPSPEV
eukprot:CAMPEP_0177413178 /NCGR_PEP_ID=MMETSP0368-20130122/66375_1 /TAXON_ID=447022 ORGANISM="Scrippsiella hangoei-like, Strain SHHI-4" /NCGR_SAMPLE_ID=MMETSP0368 /ASSEMBLY_ACC=CAM_ASM_000363 /LENGTH=144 /DNA_ID=CAMNT_0018882469 /DNA_START=59 /DNA_END=490 /DNA_ORIENTATION=+